MIIQNLPKEGEEEIEDIYPDKIEPASDIGQSNIITNPILDNPSIRGGEIKSQSYGPKFVSRSRVGMHDKDENVYEMFFDKDAESGQKNYLFLGRYGRDDDASAYHTDIISINTKSLYQVANANMSDVPSITLLNSDYVAGESGGTRMWFIFKNSDTGSAYNIDTGAGGGLIMFGKYLTPNTMDASFWIDKDGPYLGNHLMPYADSTINLGSDTVRYANVYSDNFPASPIEVSESGIESFKKIKQIKHTDGKYTLETEDLPEEFKNDGNTELKRTIGLTVQAVKELITKVEELENKLKQG